MIAIVLPRWDGRLADALLFQKNRDFRVSVSEITPEVEDYQNRLSIVQGDLRQVEEPLTCVLEPGATPDKDFLRRIARTTSRHPDFDVYHVNLPEGKPFPRKVKIGKLFQYLVVESVPAPLSSFVFRTALLREKAVFTADGAIDPIPTVLVCSKERPLRNVWRQQLDWQAPLPASDPVSVEKSIRTRLDLFHWSESFFGDEDYPLSAGERMDLFAGTIVQLFPTYAEDALKEQMASFQVSQGPIRKLRAAHALSSALKERVKQLR